MCVEGSVSADLGSSSNYSCGNVSQQSHRVNHLTLRTEVENVSVSIAVRHGLAGTKVSVSSNLKFREVSPTLRGRGLRPLTRTESESG